MREEIEEARRKVLLVGVDTGEGEAFDRSMEELKSLAEAADKQVVGIITQRLEAVNKALYIGSGKTVEVGEFAQECQAEEIIFDNALSPSQIRNLGRELELPILDRTNLILDIFALRARTREAKLQVETARLQYMLPRLVGLHEALSRQGGASGSMSNRGGGEKKLELDRRKIEHRISELKRELEEVANTRETQRKRRNQSRVPLVALVGYTNAGKSTVLNHMLELFGEQPEKRVLEKDMLFATLDTSVRRIDAGDRKPFFLVDTVGFIDKLPHGLVKAFRSTLEEVKYADLLVHVVDFSHEHYKQQMQVTEELLSELNAGDIPRIIVYNKADRCDRALPGQPSDSDGEGRGRFCVRERQIYMSALEEQGICALAEMIKQNVYGENVDLQLLIPYSEGAVASYFMEHAAVLEQEYREEGIRLRVNCHRQDADKYDRFQMKEPSGKAKDRKRTRNNEE